MGILEQRVQGPYKKAENWNPGPYKKRKAGTPHPSATLAGSTNNLKAGILVGTLRNHKEWNTVP